jgi:hypothetical protein
MAPYMAGAAETAATSLWCEYADLVIRRGPFEQDRIAEYV